jgi:hypothetical protein
MKTSDVNPFDKTEAPVKMPPSLQLFLRVAAALLAMALFVEGACRYMFHGVAPYNSPLLHDPYPDLLTLWPRFQHFHTLQFFTDTQDPLCMYPAPVAVCYRAFFAFAPHELLAFLSLLCAVVATFLFGRALIRRGLNRWATILLMSFALTTSFPLWVELKQANMEICSWVLLALGLWAFMRERGYSAAACFGIAGALKITPFLYLGLFLAKRQYRHILFAFLSAAAVTVPSLWLVYPHIGDSWRLTNLAVSRFRTSISLGPMDQYQAFDHSAFALLKKFIYGHISALQLSASLTAYSATVVVLMLFLFFGRIRKLPVINQVLCLCVAAVLLPPTSFDYTLLGLYLPWALLVLFAVLQHKKAPDPAGLVPAMVCFAILFVPETEIIYHHVAYGGQIKALALISLFYIGLRYRFPLTTSNSECLASSSPIPAQSSGSPASTGIPVNLFTGVGAVFARLG